jgi:hypothetical protein
VDGQLPVLVVTSAGAGADPVTGDAPWRASYSHEWLVEETGSPPAPPNTPLPDLRHRPHRPPDRSGPIVGHGDGTRIDRPPHPRASYQHPTREVRAVHSRQIMTHTGRAEPRLATENTDNIQGAEAAGRPNLHRFCAVHS